ncbi:hypothetical protein PMG11_11384 [Penicillium brasilianum]|uniref:Cytochrome P450 n=1 Tax=Penicillium brasilianum TaxID=104259 RepID=A0A0F7U1P8_PENBI|nr:hypothetical protein PMG11_11384 [Penicillium brasilianum]
MSQRSMVCLVQPKFFQYYIDRLFLLRDYRNIMAAGTWARERTKERLKRKDHEKDFFSLFIEGKSNDGSLQYSEKDMWVESVLLLAAGADTTSTTLCALFFHLLHNQEVLLKVIGEIRTSFTEEDDITGSQLNHCVYLDACIKETMRLVPAVPNLSPRVVNSGGLTIRGRYIPPGTIVGTSLYTLMRNSNYFDRADEFLPERWLSRGCRSQLLKLEGFEPFGTGLRSCVGMKLAELELKMTIARTLFKCDLRLCPETARYDAPAGFSFKGWAVASGEKNQIGNSYVANIAEVLG